MNKDNGKIIFFNKCKAYQEKKKKLKNSVNGIPNKYGERVDTDNSEEKK